MKYIVETTKTFEAAVKSLQETVPKHRFGVLHIHDIKATLNGKGVPFENKVQVFEVCNPQKAHAVLSEDMSLNMALPCRISVWQENGKVKIGTLKPTALISALNDSPKLQTEAQEVERSLIAIIDEAQ